ASYTYDSQSRVTQMAPGTSSALNYAYDASANLTTLPNAATGTYDNAGELTSSLLSGTTTNFTYGANGNRTASTTGSTTLSSATWNGANELTSYSDASANMTASSYNGDGLRTSATATPSGGSSATQAFVWNTLGSVPQLLMDGKNAYIYGPSGTPIEQVTLSSGTVKYLVADALGSVRGVVSSAGSLSASTSYDAWGNPETTGGLTNATPFGFAGGYSDPTGLVYLINRYYDPGTGQFLTVDPMVDQTGQAYAYTGDDPVNGVDPLGLSVWGTITGGLNWANRTLNPGYYAYQGYVKEYQARENGCSFWTVAKYGAEGVVGVASTAAAAYGAVEAIGRLGTDEFVNLASEQRTTHILQGDSTGGGHLWPGLAGKTPFPQDWSAGQIMNDISDVATDPASSRVVQGGRTIVTGTRDGVDIQVIINNRTDEIVSGYPTNLPRNP
ncbi:MAG: type secretion protein Rhs, partial [Acidimicrobiaceae bacterium]|nr:type secretion protein Rhs [Acidimicrobiaceae bacterium]